MREGSSCKVGAVVASPAGQKLGVVTSVATVEGTEFALAYLRCKLEGQPVEWEGKQVDAEGALAKVSAAFAGSTRLLVCETFTSWHVYHGMCIICVSFVSTLTSWHVYRLS